MTDTATIPLEFTTTPSQQAKADAEREAILADPGFGKYFTDHMATISWSVDEGWHDARVVPYGPLSLDPASAVLHYAQEIFEGLKVYRHADDSIWAFRPEQNALRMQRSAARLALPLLPEGHFLAAVQRLVEVDKAWVPGAPETSLYVRPFMIGSEAFLGVRGAHEVDFHVIASPAGAYFSGGVKPVSIWLSQEYTRAGRGGMGAAKTGGNYAASLLPQAEAYEQGCQQVLFLDAEERRYVEELGGMNIFFAYGDGRIVTPALSGTILEGITRSSIIALAEERGHTVEERRFSIDEWREGVESGAITEVFACGTAAVVTPIAQVKAQDFTIGSAGAPAGALTMSLREELTGIQYGRREDHHDWMVRLA
ncbi:branched-chain amino acid aminotransferase [Amnibacterium sp. CER49]|uniref:branched-chain amino acid aminotransferase n=1 Tax=Amnibacterium sp. CER49 TaxID=3039161 RepID=UPI00244A44A7|nr:branched-chain amino acid aminotransferase [Amnibacterium sp. CER49]MDH2442889.1 branched-chain amino acid aminotransferase [Amnibacterium sp. CER49]